MANDRNEPKFGRYSVNAEKETLLQRRNQKQKTGQSKPDKFDGKPSAEKVALSTFARTLRNKNIVWGKQLWRNPFLRTRQADQ